MWRGWAFWALKRFAPAALRKNLALPQHSMAGRIVARVLAQQNAFLEKCAVKLADIQPAHRVLEVGFGPGVGLKCAFWRVEEGSGLVCGVDPSDAMMAKAAKRCAEEIKAGKVQIFKSAVWNLPFPNDYFDRAFHCNCYYFWPSLDDGAAELFRVLKPGGRMLTTIHLDGLKELVTENILTSYEIDPLNYMSALESVGFKDVGIKYLPYRDKLIYQAILATKPADPETAEAFERRFRTRVLVEEAQRTTMRVRRPPPPHTDRLIKRLAKEAQDAKLLHKPKS